MLAPFLTPSQITFSPAPPSRSLWSVIKTAARSLIDAIVITSELQVNQVVSDGGVFWYAFDPRTGQKCVAETEEEIRIWIEDTYHNG